MGRGSRPGDPRLRAPGLALPLSSGESRHYSALRPRPRPLAGGEGRPGSAIRPRPRPLTAPLAPVGREALLNSSASLSPTWGGDAARHFNLALARSPVGRGEPRPRPLASGEGRPRSSFGLALDRRPRRSRQWGASQLFVFTPRPFGGEASFVSSASSSPTSQWGGGALLGYSASPSLTGRAARASGKGALLNLSTWRDHANRLFNLALAHSPVGRGEPRPPPLSSGEGRPYSAFQPRPRPPTAPLAPVGRERGAPQLFGLTLAHLGG